VAGVHQLLVLLAHLDAYVISRQHVEDVDPTTLPAKGCLPKKGREGKGRKGKEKWRDKYNKYRKWNIAIKK
jgi:hypothetical protein